MFHFAEPDEPGFGVTILTPGLARSSQVLMFFGLPLRVTMATTDWVAIPLVAPLFQSSATSFSSVSLVMSGSRDRCTSSALRPAMTARAWSPEAPYDCLKVTPLPASVFWKSEISCLLAVFRMEKPTMLTDFVPPPLPPEEAGSEQALVASREVASTAAPSHFTGVVLGMGEVPFNRVGEHRGPVLSE